MSLRLVGIAAWALAHPALYGYHLASLNGVQDVAVCQPMQAGFRAVSDAGVSLSGLHSCLAVDDSQFGFAVTIITLGGLIGSLSAELMIRRLGRNVTLRMAQAALILGGVGVGLANEIWLLAAGRLLIGIASGLIMVSIPPFLSSLSHSPTHKKLLGSLHQISIGVGMIIAQSLSLLFSRPSPPSLSSAVLRSDMDTVRDGPTWGLWRLELAIAVCLALLMAGAGLIVDADDERAVEDRTAASKGNGPDGGESQPLLQDDSPHPAVAGRHDGRPEHYGSSRRADDDDNGKRRATQLGIKEVFSGDLRYGAIIVVVALCSQQITGISPVMFFSSKILKSTFGGSSKLVTLSMMAVGIPFNFLPGLLKLESRTTLLISAAGTTLFSFLLALGLNTHSQPLSGAAVIGFVVSFSFGLAPVAWVVLSEVVPQEARTAVGSVGVGVNWATNLALGSTFIPLQTVLGAEGNIFYLFAALSGLAFVSIWASFRSYTLHGAGEGRAKSTARHESLAP